MALEMGDQEIVFASKGGNGEGETGIMKNEMKHSGKVLFCGPIDEPLNSGRYMIAGIERLGYTVIGYDYRTHLDYEQDILRIIATEKPDFVFALKGEKFSPDFVEKIKSSGCITILWFTTFFLEEWMIPLARAFDCVVVNADHNMFSLLKKGIEHVTWIHQGFAPEFFGVTDRPGVTSPTEYYADVAMIGSMGKPI